MGKSGRSAKHPRRETHNEEQKPSGVSKGSALLAGTMLALGAGLWPHSAVAAKANEDTAPQQATDEEPTETELRSATSALGQEKHTVQEGESLESIAKLHQIPTAALLALNGLSWQSEIHAGQILVVGKELRDKVEEETAKTPDLAASPVLPSGKRAGSVSAGEVISPLSDEMATNAKIIIRVAKDMGIPNYGIVIALATAAQESRLRNLDYGDLDSVGLFQQRPSSGWGTVSQIRDPHYSSKAFFGGPSSPTPGKNPGLLDIADWQRMTVTQAAQAVQRSAYPDAYAKWEVSAWNWLFELT